VLAGDPKFLWDDALNRLDIDGSATITGDLTVRTDKLAVRSTGVGIGTTTPNASYILDLTTAYDARARQWVADSSFIGSGNLANGFTIRTLSGTTDGIRFLNYAQSTEFMRIDSTGLGVGVASPTSKLTIGTGSFSAAASGTTGMYTTASGLEMLSDSYFFGNRTGGGLMTLNSSGNLGIGVTPSAWNASFKSAQVGSRLVLTTTGSDTFFGNNFYNDGAYKFINADYATYYDQTTGKHVWGTSTTSGAVNGVITWNPAMTLDASGRLLIGTTDAGSNSGIGLKAAYSATAPYFSTVGSSTSASEYSYLLYSTGGTPAFKFYVSYSGQISATSGTVAALSDARFKENIQDIDVGLGAILALKPRKFDWKAGKGKDIKGDRGFIAQEFETVFPNLIDEWADPAPEGEAPYKSVRQDLIPVLVKAIQELTARVQTLEAK
jgi:hypothetical protein